MRTTPVFFIALILASVVWGPATACVAQSAQVTPDMVQTGSDTPAKWEEPHPGYDYEKREVMIPMRDGVKLHTVLLVPKGAKGLPILLERTPYNADGFNSDKPKMRDAVWSAQREWSDDGYIMVDQDIRGKYGSEGDYVMTRPPIGPLNPTKTDDTTDAWDTIDWLVKNVPESNGRVGMIGSSYDGWMGDDWFHYGAFRQVNLDYFTGQSSRRGAGANVPRSGADDYQNFLDAGTAGHWAELNGFEQLPWWHRLSAHPAYDAFWQLQALDKLVVEKPASIPTLWLQGLWDQEDMYGAVHTWEALKAAGHAANNHLVMGPWRHSQVNGSAETLGPLKWKGDTAADFRREMLIPFFDTYLKDRKPTEALAAVLIYNPVENHWDKFADWPGVDEKHLTPLYLEEKFELGLEKPKGGEDSYVSDPAKPVPFLTPPVEPNGGKRWTTWLVEDQRAVGTRTDVLTYETSALEKTVRLEGAPFADLFVKTTGTDADFVVKIIDVYPPAYAEQPELAGYELAISMDIFRGRYRKSFAAPEAIPSGAVEEYRFRLPTVNYVFKPGHRIMVQIQSSLFPLYDRNPQTFVPNIFFAKPEDFRAATMTVEHGPQGTSAVLLPIVAEK
jgi:putative CocE/NonD family hydrolase